MKGTIDFIRRKRILIIGSVLLFLLLIVLLPSLMFKWQMSQLELESVVRIEYIEYEDTAFGSPIKIKKVLSEEEDFNILRNLIEEINAGKRNAASNISKQSKDVLFFYHRDGRIINAYVKDNLLGFDFGSKWIKVEKLNNIIMEMNLVEVLSITEENI